MTTSPRSDIAPGDPDNRTVQLILRLQNNPHSLTGSWKAKGASTRSTDRLETLRLKGPTGKAIRLAAAGDAREIQYL